MDERKHFERIARELTGDGLQQALWQQMLRAAGGDRERARVDYIRARHDQLQSTDRAPAPALSLAGDPPRTSEAPSGHPRAADGADNASPAQRRLRGELASELRAAGKTSLYAALGLPPECSDGDIQRVIADLKRTGSDREAGKRYAIESLGAPDARQAYDRRLLDQLRGIPPEAAIEPADSISLPALDDASNASRRYVWIAGSVALIAAAYVSAQWGIRTQIDAAEEQAIEQSRAAQQAWKAQEAANEQRLRAQWAKRDALDAEARLRSEREQREAADARAEVERQRQAQQDAQAATARARRDEATRARAEARRNDARAAAEHREAERAAREARYWACMKRALESPDSARARAACGRQP